MITLLLLLGCEQPPADTGGPDPDGVTEPDSLDMPELTQEELEALVADGLALALSMNGQAPWLGLGSALERAEPGCPDVYAGDLPSFTASETGGWGWEDACTGAAGARFDGYLWWLSQITVNGVLGGSPPGRALARRVLTGEGAVSEGAEVRYVFEGNQDETLDMEVGREDVKWTYSGEFDVSTWGSDAFAETDPTPNGWRAAGSITTHGGDLWDFSLAMEAYFFGTVLDGRMDALSADLDWSLDPEGEGCDAEPFGSLSLRLADGTWLDMAYLEAGGNSMSPDCDGCATLYVRGLEAGQVCPELGWIWDGRLAPPPLTDWVLSARDVGLEP